MEGCVSNTQNEKAMLILKTALFLLVHGFQGTNSLWTVSKVAVQAGGSVTIPCHYHRMFQQRMKYWCKGRRWNVCRELGRTTSKPRTEGFSITDYPSEQFFTITMTNLQEKDTDRYWCAVKRSAWDSVRASMEVEVTEDPPDLSVRENMVSVEEGANATITCSYTDRLKSSEKMWCESGDLLSCKSGLTSTTSQEPSFTIADDGSGVFNVTVVKLQRKHTGWYWCSAGGLQAPVHINVTRRPDELINITGNFNT
ncbi:CMRF35-like molecule 7 [Engraulis encrasicolus]|uniref:CMRF35-like molecule 7 n=1 Tax=Engraulis encrasicolus TaxID=184585 RepID=UPI002FD5A042